MKVMITGGAGFVGSHVADACTAQGYETFVVDNFSTGLQTNISESCHMIQGDITKPEIRTIIHEIRPDFLFHFAAQSSVPVSVKDPRRDAEINVLGTINVLEAASEARVKKIIYASTAAVYGEPVNLPIDETHPVAPMSYYGISKFVPELYLKVFMETRDLPFTALRYANVYGPRQIPHGEGGVISIFVDRMLKGEPVTIHGDGRQTRDFIYISDIVAANMAAMDKGDGKILNIGTGKSTSVKALAETIRKMVDQPVKIEYGNPREGDIRDSYFDPSRAKEALLWKPKIDLETGLKQTVEYYRSRMS